MGRHQAGAAESRQRRFKAIGGGAAAAAADPDDLLRLHHGRRAAGRLHRCRCRDASRHGRWVFSGMLGVTFFGLFLTPVFYVLLRGVEKRVARGSVAGGSHSSTAAHYIVAGERNRSSA